MVEYSVIGEESDAMNTKKTGQRRIGIKISFIVSILCIISILLITILAIHNSSSALHEEAFAKLKAVQTIKKNQLQSQFSKVFEDIKLASQNSEMVNIIRIFMRYHDEMKLKDGQFDISSSHPDVTTQYDELYRQAHTLLRKYSEIHGYLDVLLLCQKHGHIMYSSARGRDFATSLRTGNYRDSHLSTLWKKARLVKYPVLTDIDAYAPSGGDPAMFLGMQIHQHGKSLGVLVFRLPFTDIDEIMQERTGLGKSGQTYLVGIDKRMRSNSILFPSTHSLSASFHGTVENNGVDTESVVKAFAGHDGQQIITDHRGQRVLSSYSTISIQDVYWAIIAEIDEEEIIRPIKSLMYTIIVAAAGILVVVILAALFMGKTISTPIQNIENATRKIAQGDFDERIVVHSDDEVGSLASSINQMASRLKTLFTQNETQLWQTDQLAMVSQIVRGEFDLRTMANRLCQFFAESLESQIITLYTLNDQTLTLTGSYAFSKRKELGSSIQLGEGFVGQAALEKQIISVSNIPDDYIRINSSLGNTHPNHLVIVPFLYNDKIQGVMEIGSFKELETTQLDFLQQVIAPVGISIHTLHEQERMKTMLLESQLLTEELQHKQDELKASEEELQQQTEELRATNEELETQTQSLKVSQEQLENKQAELTTKNNILEEISDDLEKQKVEVENRNLELLRARKELEGRAEDLALASKYKSEFLANMSHELRTPLNSLLILAQSLTENKEKNLTEKQVQASTIILESGHDLLNLINEILDLSKIEAGRVETKLEEIDLRELAENANTMFSHMAEEKGLTFLITIAPDLRSTIISDKQRVEQILKNFIGNGIKFTESGEVRLTFERASDSIQTDKLKAENAIAISVSDTGIGIPADKQKAVFEALQQADGSTARLYGGTGLGLSISRELASLLGGEIQLTSEPGKGSTFTLFLPMHLSEERSPAKQEPAEIPPVANGTVKATSATTAPPKDITDDRENLEEHDEVMLIIEDDLPFAETLLAQCHERHFKAIISTTGEEGIELALKYQPAGIILDINLPGIDGLTVLNDLKHNSNTRHIPVHMMSAEEVDNEAFKQGAIGFLTKPITQEQLSEAFTKFESVISRDIKKLLIVEDDDTLRAVIVDLIGNGDVTSIEAQTGNEAVSLLQQQKFDCMILDLGLPDMTGLELLNTLSEIESISVPPVIIYTGRDLSREEEIELSRYSDSIILKDARSKERLLDESSLFLHRVIEKMPEKNQKIITDLHDRDLMFQEKKVLLVDDDMRNVFALSGALEARGIQVEIAEDGNKALTILEQDKDFDLILMDIMMPVMDGYEAIRKIREQKEFWKLPILALTAKAMKEDRTKCIEAGASDYLAKPVDLERLFSMMRVWLYR